MHWILVQEMVTECEAYCLAKSDCYPMPDFGKETLIFCIVELAAQIRRVNRALADEVKRAPLPERPGGGPPP